MSTVLVRTVVCLLILSVGSLEAVKCWQFTWPGTVDWDSPIDNETTCEGKSNPCIEPFVLSMNSTPPDLDKLDKLCYEGECPPELWCNTKGGESCVKYAYWTTDAVTYEPKLVNYSLFCGVAHSGNTDDGIYDTTVTDGCYQQTVSSYTLETCFCHNKMQCNSAGGLSLSAWLLTALAACSVAAASGTWRT